MRIFITTPAILACMFILRVNHTASRNMWNFPLTQLSVIFFISMTDMQFTEVLQMNTLFSTEKNPH